MDPISKQIQDNFLKRIKSALPANVSFVDELADILGLSNDSAYRRLRGETPLNIEEISTLCARYKVSFDADMRPDSGKVYFEYNTLNNQEDHFQRYLNQILGDLKKIGSAPEKEIIYAADDVLCFIIFIQMRSFVLRSHTGLNQS
jgi:hypothetical protein